VSRRGRSAVAGLALALAGFVLALVNPGAERPRAASFELGPGPIGPLPVPVPVPTGPVDHALSSGPPQPDHWFAPSSFWNQPLPRDAAIEPLTPAWVSRLQAKVARWKPWINTTQYSVPIYVVPGDRPVTSVYIDNYDSAHQANFQRVPLPASPRPAQGSDRQLVVYQPAIDTMWEFWGFYWLPDGWHAGSAARITGVQSSPGIVEDVNPTTPFPSPYGATATGLPLLGGLITPAELKAGRIDHALAVAIPHPLLRFTWAWPAQRSDGDSVDRCDIPEGARFRLPPDLNVDSLGLSPVARTIAHAVQTYGLVVRDRGDAVAFYAQDPQTMDSNPYPALFQNKWPDAVLAGFPWDKLQALKANTNIPLPQAARVSRRVRRGRARGSLRAGSSACLPAPA
jgi:hypothetical protein